MTLNFKYTLLYYRYINSRFQFSGSVRADHSDILQNRLHSLIHIRSTEAIFRKSYHILPINVHSYRYK